MEKLTESEKYKMNKENDKLRKRAGRLCQKLEATQMWANNSSSSSSSFKHNPAKQSSVKTVEESPPKSPGKLSEVLSQFAPKFNMRISLTAREDAKKMILRRKSWSRWESS